MIPARYARGLLVRVSLDRFGRELLRKSQADLTQLMKRRGELGEGATGGLESEVLEFRVGHFWRQIRETSANMLKLC